MKVRLRIRTWTGNIATDAEWVLLAITMAALTVAVIEFWR